MEKTIGADLFTRKNKTVVLNAEGEYFLPIAKELVETTERGLKKFERHLNDYDDEIRLGVAPQIANSVLPLLLKSFFAQFNRVHVDVEVMKSNEIAHALFERKIDIGLSKIHPMRDLYVEEIISEPIVLIVPSNKEHLSIEELLTNETILTHEYAPYWQDIARYLQKEYPYARYMKVNQTETIKNFVKENIGIAFLPKSVAKYSNQQGLAIIPISFSESCVPKTYLLSKHMSAHIQAFLHVCQQLRHE